MLKKQHRQFAMFLLFMYLFLSLFSVVFVVHELNHTCTGTDCEVCAIIQQVEQTLKSMGNAGGSVSVLLPLFVFAILAFACVQTYTSSISLISLKVRLDY